MNKPDGGPAFARPESPQGKFSDSRVPRDQEGMSLRDYFAAKAMQTATSVLAEVCEEDAEMVIRKIASASYMIADAMIAQRDK